MGRREYPAPAIIMHKKKACMASLRAAGNEDRDNGSCKAEHENEAALLSALVVRCEQVDQLTMFN